MSSTPAATAQSPTIPKTMKAMVLMRHGDMDALEWHEDWPVPIPGPEEVLIKVTACGLNNTDVNTRTGWYSKSVKSATSSAGYGDATNMEDQEDPAWGGSPIQFPRIQGADVCGVVVRVGEQADPGLLGKRIITDNWLRDWEDPLNKHKTGYYGSEKDGGFAEYTVTHFRNVAAIPDTVPLTDAELATFSCSWTTAEGMLDRAGAGPGDRVLVTGASGGVGSALLQLAQRRQVDSVIALASPSKHAQVLAAGADHVLPRAPENLQQALLEATGKHGTVTVVADIVGGHPNFANIVDVLDRGGHYTCSGAIAGPMVELDLRTLYLRDLTFHGSTAIPPRIFQNVVSYIEKGELRPMLAKTYPLKDLKEAQQAFIDKKHTGNIVVIP